MSSKKHYIITSIVLGSIAAVSGALIGVTNLITKDRIAENEANKIKEGIKEIFDQNDVKFQGFELKDAGLNEEDYKYVTYMYVVKDASDNDIGVAFKTNGSNMYGKMSLIVGYDAESQLFIDLSVIVNEQTYATTLVDNYINPLHDGTISIDDVSCGATYGAKLVRDMVYDAQSAAEEYYK